MNKTEIIAKVKSLHLPRGSYVVFGAAPMAILGIREANDIDLFVSPEIHKHLKKLGWKILVKGPKDTPLTYDVFEAHDNWNFSKYSPTLQDLLATAFEVDGVTFASMEEVRKWKAITMGPKHLADIKMIDKYVNATKDDTP